jgi:hypothetical protein
VPAGWVGRAERAELIAVDVYRRACTDVRAVRVTRGMVEQRLEQLAGHRASCRCGRCWWLVGHWGATVKTGDVWSVLRSWGVAQASPVAVFAAKTACVARERPSRIHTSPRACTCVRCGAVFTAKRVDAQYCSAGCRVAAHRSRR